MPSTLAILQVSTADQAGGAERAAWNLYRGARERGHFSWLAVGHKRTPDPNILLVPNESCRSVWVRTCYRIRTRLRHLERRIPGAAWTAQGLSWLAEPLRQMDIRRGIEDFHFPGSHRLLELCPSRPDIVHCHNLHGRYFDLRILPALSHRVPVVLSARDAWLLAGHCAHSFGCERWRSGCGRCPDLSIPPAIHRDGTALNWTRKQRIYAGSRLWISTPSQWLMDRVKASMLKGVEYRVIHNGVDLRVFHPGDQRDARRRLDLPQDAKILLFVGTGGSRNPWKDYPTLDAAVTSASAVPETGRVIFICLGERRDPERIGHAERWFVPYQSAPMVIADLYRAADVYLHAARADTFPNVILEALACGTPVVATAVGGIPEQIDDGSTGFLTPPGDVEAMAARIIQLLGDGQARRAMSIRAALAAQRRFDLNRQIDEHLSWYQEIAESVRSNTDTQ